MELKNELGNFIYAFFTVLAISTGMVVNLSCNYLFSRYSFVSLVLRGLVCVVVINIIYLSIFFRTKEFKYLFKVFKNQKVLNKLKVRLN